MTLRIDTRSDHLALSLALNSKLSKDMRELKRIVKKLRELQYI